MQYCANQSHCVAVGKLDASKDGDKRTKTTGRRGSGSAVRLIFQGTATGQCECCPSHSGGAERVDLIKRDFVSFGQQFAVSNHHGSPWT